MAIHTIGDKIGAIDPYNLTSVDDALTYIAWELREALDCGDPPADGRESDSFHASCCVLRAWAVLTGNHFAALRALSLQAEVSK